MGRKQKYIKMSWKYVEGPERERRLEQAFDMLFELLLEEQICERGERSKKKQTK